jgi:hypothetical protein
MYPALLLVLVFVGLMACVHRYATGDKKLYSQLGLSFALICAVLIAADYFIQLAVMQPSLLKGETEGLSLFSQYNPHGIFIALEDLGYLMMSLAFLCTAAVLAGRGRLERALRWLFIFGSLGAIASLIALTLVYGVDLEYRFEVVAITINWTVLIVSGVLLSILFRHAWRYGSAS